jgi:hypothetical protein
VAYFVPGFGVVNDQKREDTSGRSSTKQGELYPVDNRSDGLVFQFNPDSIERRRMPQYAEVGAAAADYWQAYNGPSPLQWVRNPPEQISFELLLTETGTNDVEAQLAKLRNMLSKSSRSPQGSVPGPSDLVFMYGKRQDRVRIVGHDVKEERHTAELAVQQARVKLDLKTIRAGNK